MIIAYIPALAAIIGVLMYALCANPKLQEMGKIIFLCGFLVTMLTAAHATFKLGS